MKLMIIETDEAVSAGITQIIREHFVSIEITAIAASVKEAVRCYFKDKPDILIMAVNMGGANAFELFEYIEPAEPVVIFLSVSREFAVEAFKFNTVDFLIQPFSEEVFVNALQKAVKLSKMSHSFTKDVSEQQPVVSLSEKYLPKTIKVENLIKICSDGSYSRACLTDGKVIYLSRNIGFYEKKLSSDFIRTHKTRLVNKIHIVDYKSGMKPFIILSDGTSEPLARTRKREIIELLSAKQQQR